LKYDALYPNASRLTTLTNNHDTVRFMSLEGATVEGALLHLAFTLSVRGTPQLYAGEEIGMEGKDDPDNRRDFPGGFPSDKRSAFTATGRNSVEQRIYQWTQSWIRLRAEHSALRTGQLIDLFYDENAYVFARKDENETVLIAFNRANAERMIKIPVRSIGLADGAEMRALIGNAPAAKAAKGQMTISVPARTAIAFGTT
jgi:glycosidase